MVGSSSYFIGLVYRAPAAVVGPAPRTGEGGQAVAWQDEEATDGLLVNAELL